MFRVTIRGTFDGLSDTGPVTGADAFQAAFTEAGTFTGDRSHSAFTFRCQVPAAPDDGEQEATQRAIAALDAHGHPYRILRVAVTDMRDVRIRRKRQQR
ncbi:hypothetical protein FAF44_08160 [Nonomuraea sp. MG754425]|nr:hypothetical protein [Nonomuraea sp. MG754425]